MAEGFLPFLLFFTSSVGFRGKPASSRYVEGWDLPSPRYVTRLANQWTPQRLIPFSAEPLRSQRGGPQQILAGPLGRSPQLRARLGTQEKLPGLWASLPHSRGSRKWLRNESWRERDLDGFLEPSVELHLSFQRSFPTNRMKQDLSLSMGH